MAAFLAARSSSSCLTTRPAGVQRLQGSPVSLPFAVRPIRAQRVVTRATDLSKEQHLANVLQSVLAAVAQELDQPFEQTAPDAKFVDMGATSENMEVLKIRLEDELLPPSVGLPDDFDEKITTPMEAAELIAQMTSK